MHVGAFTCMGMCCRAYRRIGVHVDALARGCGIETIICTCKINLLTVACMCGG